MHFDVKDWLEGWLQSHSLNLSFLEFSLLKAPDLTVPFGSPSESLFTPLISFEEGCQHWVGDAAHYLNTALTSGRSADISCPVSPAALASTETLTPSGREGTAAFPSSTRLLSLCSQIASKSWFLPELISNHSCWDKSQSWIKDRLCDFYF